MSKYLDLDSIELSKRQIGKLFGVEVGWVDRQIDFGHFPSAKIVAGKPIWNAMNVYHWWSEIYLEPENCDNEHGRRCTAIFDQKISSLFND